MQVKYKACFKATGSKQRPSFIASERLIRRELIAAGQASAVQAVSLGAVREDLISRFRAPIIPEVDGLVRVIAHIIQFPL